MTGEAKESGGRFILKKEEIQTHVIAKRENIMQWHLKMGYPSDKILHFLFPNKTCKIKDISNKCEACIKAKMSRLPFILSNHTVENYFELIHSYIWGPTLLRVSIIKCTLSFLLMIHLKLYGYNFSIVKMKS